MNSGKTQAIVGYIKGRKSIWAAIILIVIGIAIMMFGSGNSAKQTDYGGPEDVSALEERVKVLCQQINGVGNASVMITLDTTGEQVYAKNTRVFGNGENTESLYEYVTASGGLVPIEARLSKIRGIAVVCGGGADPGVRLTLTELLCSLFDIPASAVYIAFGK